jgi:hypothetical protein
MLHVLAAGSVVKQLQKEEKYKEANKERRSGKSQSYFTIGCLPPISSSWSQAP